MATCVPAGLLRHKTHYLVGMCGDSLSSRRRREDQPSRSGVERAALCRMVGAHTSEAMVPLRRDTHARSSHSDSSANNGIRCHRPHLRSTRRSHRRSSSIIPRRPVQNPAYFLRANPHRHPVGPTGSLSHAGNQADRIRHIHTDRDHHESHDLWKGPRTDDGHGGR